MTSSIKLKLINWCGWLLLIIGIGLTIFPLFFDSIGHNSGLLAFVIIFVGISLLKYRKDQLNQ